MCFGASCTSVCLPGWWPCRSSPLAREIQNSCFNPTTAGNYNVATIHLPTTPTCSCKATHNSIVCLNARPTLPLWSVERAVALGLPTLPIYVLIKSNRIVITVCFPDSSVTQTVRDSISQIIDIGDSQQVLADLKNSWPLQLTTAFVALIISYQSIAT
jgi:hypothetical protein